MARILIAEPDDDCQALLVSACTALGHEVMGAGDAFAVLAAAMAQRPDILAISITLPKGRTQEVLRLLTEAGAAPRRVIGLGRHGDSAATLPTANAWLRWPLDLDELKEALDGTA